MNQKIISIILVLGMPEQYKINFFQRIQIFHFADEIAA